MTDTHTLFDVSPSQEVLSTGAVGAVSGLSAYGWAAGNFPFTDPLANGLLTVGIVSVTMAVAATTWW